MRKFLTLFSLMLAAMVGTANADYYVGEQIGLSDLRDGDLVIFEAACASSYYGRYLTDGTVNGGRELTNRSAIRSYQGLTDAAVWRVVSTGTAGRFYLQSVSSGYYYAKSLGQMTDDLSSADAVIFYQFPDGFATSSQTQRFDSWSGNPVGWNDKSIALHTGNYSSYYLCSSSSDMIYGDQYHGVYWNMFRVSTNSSEGTSFSSYDGTSSTTSGVTIDGLVYNLTTRNTPSGNNAILTTGNKNNSSASVNIPASVTYNGQTYNVNGFQGAAFENGTFSTLTFEEPNTFFIPDWAFGNCNNVQEVVVPEGVSILVSNRAFGYMSSLTTVTLPSTMKRVEDYTFSEDPSLTTIICKGTTPPYFTGSHLFENTPVANITVYVPTPDAVSAYTTALASYNVTDIQVNPDYYGTAVTDLSQLSDDKYYFIISQFDGFHNGATPDNPEGKEAALGYSSADGVSGSLANMVSWVVQKRTEPDANVVWKIIKTGDNYKLQNVGSGKYAGAAADESKIGWTDDFEVAQVLTPTTGNAFTIGNAVPASNVTTWKISGGYHGNIADFLQAATGTDPYGGTAGSERAWKIYELSDAQVDILTADLLTQLELAVGAGEGVVMGMKDAASLAEAQAVLAGSPTYEELKSACNNIMPLTDGYYRIKYPKNYLGICGEPYLYFTNTLQLSANKDVMAAKEDYSTVYTVTVINDSYQYTHNNNYGYGYEAKLVAQGGYSPYYSNSYTVQKEVTADNSNVKAHIFQPELGFDDGTKGALIIDVSQSGGSYTYHSLIKTSDAVDNAIKANPPRSSGATWPKSHEAYIEPAEDITIVLHEVNGEYWGTLYVPFGVTLPEGTEAYVGVVDTENNTLRLTNIGQDVPAGTAVVLRGDATYISAAINANIADYTGTNALTGQYLAASAANDNIRALGTKNGVIGFYKLSSALGANKAYLDMSSTSPGFRIVIDDDDVTGINDAVNGKSLMVNDQYYDLQGRKVATPQKGSLYIQNGKVVKF